MPEYLTLQEVADQMRVDIRTVRRWIAGQKLAAVRVGRHWRVERSALDAALAKAAR